MGLEGMMGGHFLRDDDPGDCNDWLAEDFHDQRFSELEWKERCINDFLNALSECLKFMTFRELIRLMVSES
jgi:hypothetical protein